MKQIPLTRGLFALVDDEDYEFLMHWKWYAVPAPATFYAARNILGEDGKKRLRLMHRQILDVSERFVFIDHQNGNGLDNQRANIRMCTPSQNSSNRDANRDKIVPIKGVQNISNGKWIARICRNKKVIYLGCFETCEEAAHAYNEKAKELHGGFARLNKI